MNNSMGRHYKLILIILGNIILRRVLCHTSSGSACIPWLMISVRPSIFISPESISVLSVNRKAPSL